MAFNMFKKRKKQDYLVEINFISDLHGYDGKDIIIKWKRGKKENNNGKFPPVKMNGAAKRQEVYGMKLNLHCTLFEKQKSGFYEEKLIQFTLESSGKKICSGVLDLAQFADLDGNREDTMIELKTKSKHVKAHLIISIISTEGVSTGMSENTENLNLDSSEEAAYSPRNHQPKQIEIHSSLISQMRQRELQKEDKEEEMLRKKQMKERDEMMKNEEPEFLGDFLGDLPERGPARTMKRSENDKSESSDNEDFLEEKHTMQMSRNMSRREKVRQSINQSHRQRIQTMKITQKNEKEKERGKEKKKHKHSESSEMTEEEINEEDKQLNTVKGIFENEFVNNDKMCDMFKKYDDPQAVKYIIGKFVEENLRELIPLLDQTLFSERSIFEESKINLEQYNSKRIMRKILDSHEYLQEQQIEEEIIEKVTKQSFHFIGFYVLDTLLKSPEKICCSRGFQFKYFMSHMDIFATEFAFKPISKGYQEVNVITDIANLFMLHHVVSANDLTSTFPSLTINAIYQLLSNFHTDEMDPDPISQSYLRTILSKCTEEPIPTRFTYVI